jgi:hypothetical protein
LDGVRLLKNLLTGGVEPLRQFLASPVTIGVTGMSWWAEIATDGSIVTSDDERTLGFHVAAEDRWHHGPQESGVRQVRRDGVPVVETRMRVPNGDIVQTVFATAHRGGMVIIDFYNDSPVPVAIGIDRGDVVIDSVAAVGSVAGADLGSDAVAISLGHHTSTRVALVPRGVSADRSWFDGAPTADAVVAGWKTIVDRAGRMELPPGVSGSSISDAVVGARCAWLLGELVDANDDPVSALLEWDQLCRMGERAEPLVDDVAHAVERVARKHLSGASMALSAAERILLKAEESRAASDVREIGERLVGTTSLRSDSLATAVRTFEERLAAPNGGTVEILGEGLPNDWSLQPIEVFHLPATAMATVSYAVRWHGLRPAIVWEVEGGEAALCAPALDANWSSSDAKGETLLAHTAEVVET